MAEINITIFHPTTSRTDAISLPLSATLSDLASFASALLDLDGDIVILRDRRRIFDKDGNNNNKTLDSAGLGDGDFLTVIRAAEWNDGGSSGSRQRSRPNPGGGLDFSNLLAASAAPASAPSNGLTFNIPGLSSASTTTSSSSQPIQWPGMNLDDAISRNPNVTHLMTLLVSPRHPNLLKELNHHNPSIYKKLLSAKGDIASMSSIWRESTMKSSIGRFLALHEKQSKETEMTSRLRSDPHDVEAVAYFADKLRKENVQRQYEQMMELYPESMGRVLMLYIRCSVNDRPLDVFVDSGAQMTIMSMDCAKRLGLERLIDDRFEGTAVGVGTGKILGKIHIVDLRIGGYDFPCSVTVMDSKEGLGDKNMDCLFGLDMLKRHRCCIDLGKNALIFPSAGLEAPFLHEKDLPVEKGGTLGFDADRENAAMEARWEEMEKKEGGGEGKKGDETMDESK